MGFACEMRVNMAGQHGILTLFTNNDAKLWQMDKTVHGKHYKWVYGRELVFSNTWILIFYILDINSWGNSWGTGWKLHIFAFSGVTEP